jgi:uncharacterized protein (TIGR02284 family)
MANPSTGTIDQLNSFLRGELSAVETYRQAIGKLQNHRDLLQQCEQSHASRVTALADEIRRRGGAPAESSGLWGQFATAVEGSAVVLGEKAAIAALEEGEDHGRDDYKRDLKDLDAPARQFVELQLLPEQKRTHDAISALKKRLS